MADGQLRRAIERKPDGVSLKECIAECGPALGQFPEGNRWLLMYPLYGHLSHLESIGEAVRVCSGEHVRWKAV
jgi:hypothetical protein